MTAATRMPYDSGDVELSVAKAQVAALRATGEYERVEYVNRRPEGGQRFARVYVWINEEA